MGRRSIYVVAIVLFAGYALWMLGPYLRSVVVRDAAVTTWSRRAVAPIAGRIVGDLPPVGTTVGADGVVATIENTLLLAEERNVEVYRDAVIRAEGTIAEANEYIAGLEAMDAQRIKTRDRQEALFHSQIETRIASLTREIAVTQERIAVLQRVTERQKALVGRGAGAQASLDEALLRLAEARSRHAELSAELAFANLRDRATEDGVFLTADGETPSWVHYSALELDLELRRARHALHSAERDRAEAQRDLAGASRVLSALERAEVTAPPGTVVESVVAAPGQTVTAGDIILQWIDCSAPMIDVPVSDAELPLIRPGMAAEVILEGEPTVRAGTVAMTRGASATLGRADLASVAKGRTAGLAQVLVRLDTPPAPEEGCLVGRAAYVEFPGVGLIDVVRARLRL